MYITRQYKTKQEREVYTMPEIEEIRKLLDRVEEEAPPEKWEGLRKIMLITLRVLKDMVKEWERS